MELASRYLRLLEAKSEKKKPSLRETRESAGYSADHVANALNISTNTLYKYERNPATLRASLAIKIARLYGVSIDDINFS